MAYSNNRNHGRGRGGPPQQYGGRDMGYSPGNRRNSSGPNHPPGKFSNTMKSVPADEHDRYVRERKRAGSPHRQNSPLQKRPVYDSRDDSQYGRYGNGAPDNLSNRGNPGPMDYGERGVDRSYHNMPDSRPLMNTPGPGGGNQLPPSNQQPLFPSSMSTTNPTGQAAPKPLKSILKKKNPTSMSEPASQAAQTKPLEQPVITQNRPQQQIQNRENEKRRLPGMASYLDPEDEDKFLYGEDIGKQINAAMEKASSHSNQFSGSGMWMHPNERGSLQSLPTTSAYSAASTGLGLQTTASGITALSDESMSTIQAALASLKQTTLPQSQPQLFAPTQSKQIDVLSALPNISGDLLSSLKLPSNLLSGLGTQQSPKPQTDLLSSLSRSQTSELLSTVSQLQASLNRQPSTDSFLANRLAQSAPAREEPKKDETTHTIQNILQSIGFDFGMSKRMQELAREKDERENKVKEKDICINQSASFLGGGLSGADLTAGLFKRKETPSRNQKPESKDMKESKKTEENKHEKEAGQKIESVLSSKIESVGKDAPVDHYDPYLQPTGTYPPPHGYHTPVGLPVGPPGYPPGLPPGIPPPGFQPPPHGFYGGPPAHMSPHPSMPARGDNKNFDDFDDFNRSANRSRRSSSKERSRSRSRKRDSRSPRRLDSKDRSPRRSSSKRLDSRERSPRKSDLHSPKRRMSPSPKRRKSPSPKRKRSLSPRRKRSLSPKRRRSREKRSSKERDRRSSKDRERRPSSKDRARKSSMERTRRSSRERDRRRSSKERDRRASSKERDIHGSSRERRGNSKDRKISDRDISSSANDRSSRIESADKEKKMPEDFKIQIGANADSRRVVASNVLEGAKESTREPSTEPTRIVLMPKSEQHIRKIMVAPKQEPPKPVEIPPEMKIKLKQEHDERQKKLDTLEKEMEKLKKQQNEIMRKRQRQKDGHKDPLLTANSKLQEEISEQIKALRKATEVPVDVKSFQVKEETKSDSSPKQPVSSSSSSSKNYKFKDHGSHWCRCCNVQSDNILQLCKHLQSKTHQQKLDPYDRPWTLHSMKKKQDSSKGPYVTLPLSGTEFVMSVDAFYCSLCNEFMGDIPSAEAHLNDVSHFNSYKTYIQKNPFYEKRYLLEKTAKLSMKKEEREHEQRKEIDRNKQINKEKDAKIKEREKKWDKKVDDLSDDNPNQRQKRGNSTDIKLKLSDKNEHKEKSRKEEEKQYGKFTWKKEGSNKSLVNPTVKLGQDEEVVEPVPPPSTTLFPKPKLFIPDANEQHFPKIAPKAVPSIETSKESEKSKAESTKTSLSSKKDKGIIPTLIGRVTRSTQAKKAVLPSWTPVTRKIPSKVYQIPKNEQQSKSQAENPAPLEEFLSTTEEGKDKKVVPVVPEVSLSMIPLPPTPNTSEKIDEEEKEDLKMLGIDPDSLVPLAKPKAPPPISQNLSLCNKAKNMSATSASNMYGIYYENVNGNLVVKKVNKQEADAVATNENNKNVEAENTKLMMEENASVKDDNLNEIDMDIDEPVDKSDGIAETSSSQVTNVPTEKSDESSVTDKNASESDKPSEISKTSSEDKKLPEYDSNSASVTASDQEVKNLSENIKSEAEKDTSTDNVKTESDKTEEKIEVNIESEKDNKTENPDTNTDIKETKEESKIESNDDVIDQEELSNDSTIIMSLENDFMEGMTVIDDDDDNDDDNSEVDHLEGMTVIDEHNDDDFVGENFKTNDIDTDQQTTEDLEIKDTITETDLSHALDNVTEVKVDPEVSIQETVDNNTEENTIDTIMLPVEVPPLVPESLIAEEDSSLPLSDNNVLPGEDVSLTRDIGSLEGSLQEGIPVEGEGDIIGLSVSMIDNFSEESDSNKCFDPCLADSVADETVSLVEGISVLEPSDPVDPDDTICPDEFKGIALEIPGDQEELDISDGQSLGSSVDMGSDFEVLDECDEEPETETTDG